MGMFGKPPTTHLDLEGSGGDALGDVAVGGPGGVAHGLLHPPLQTKMVLLGNPQICSLLSSFGRVLNLSYGYWEEDSHLSWEPPGYHRKFGSIPGVHP